MADKNVSERVPAIDEGDLNGYFNTKKEIIYKNIIWDLMNKRYAKAKTQTQEKMKKGTKKRVVDSKTEDDHEKKKRRLSSKVNFDVLEKLVNAEPEPKKPEEEEVDTEGCKESEDNGENIVEAQSYEEGDGEVEQYENDNEYDEEIDYGNMCYGDEDEEGYNYDDEEY